MRLGQIWRVRGRVCIIGGTRRPGRRGAKPGSVPREFGYAIRPPRSGVNVTSTKGKSALSIIEDQAKLRRSRANLRPRSRSASVIDRLFKNQNLLENGNNLRSSSPRPGPGQTFGQPRRNFAVRNSSTREPWLFRSPVFGSGIRRLDGEAVGGRRLARTPPEVSRSSTLFSWG